MLTGSVAGHTFTNGLCACGRRWVDIMTCTRADIDQPNIAHSGRLTGHEADEIVAAKEKQDKRIADAFGWREKAAA
jgi:hypothetical protein